jgi:hypothetical protein
MFTNSIQPTPRRVVFVRKGKLIMQRLLTMSLLLGGMTAIAAAQSAALKSNEIFISHADPETESDLKAAAPEEAPVSAVYPDGEAKSVAEDVWKPQLQIQLQMTVVEEATQQPGQAPGPPRQFGAHVTAPQFASVYCDNSRSISSRPMAATANTA